MVLCLIYINTVYAEDSMLLTDDCEVEFDLNDKELDSNDGKINTGKYDDGHTFIEGDEYTFRKKWKFLSLKKTLIRKGKSDIRFNKFSGVKSGKDMCDLNTLECKINFCNMVPTYFAKKSIEHDRKLKHSMSIWYFNIPNYHNDVMIIKFNSKKHSHHNGIIHAGESGN
jgi:hypothetical protein